MRVKATWYSESRAVLPRRFDLDTLNGTNGFQLDGIDAIDYSGFSVSSAGDVNGDGFDDLIIGAYGGSPGGDIYAGVKATWCSGSRVVLPRRSTWTR